MIDVHMANGSSGSLDEFFDFAQLERDRNIDSSCYSQEAANNALPPVREEDLLMDWERSLSTSHHGISQAAATHQVHDTIQAARISGIEACQPHLDLKAPDLNSHLGPAANINVYEDEALFLDGNVVSDLSGQCTSSTFTSDGHDTFGPSSAFTLIQKDVPALQEESSRSLAEEDFSEVGSGQKEFNRHTSSTSRKPASAKRKGPQSRIPLEARQILEDEFAANPYPCSWEIDIIAHQANLDVKKVRNWYNNTRSRRKCTDSTSATKDASNMSSPSLHSKLSKESLEALDKQAEATISPPQPPLEYYLAQSYQEEAVNLSAIQAALDNGSLSDDGDFQAVSSADSKFGRPGSAITSLTSSDGTAPTTYTVSSSGSNISSFGRERRRGRRRMTWRASPYTRTKFNGLNSAGENQENLPFFCTFCPRAFKTKYEWIRHEDSVHALRTTYICCDTKHASLQSCPFCGLMHPDEVHLATHKYQQCRNKPESQRTFYRRDHFVQHLHHVHFANVKHPSARLGCQARLMASEGHNFGCKDLAIKWRRFGAPMKADDPMLHCGFCGKRLSNWSERCEHVAEHLIARELDRSTWWPERLENHLENLCDARAGGPFRCRYCRKVFANPEAMDKHSHCRVWSCRFLRSFGDIAAENAGPPLCPQFPSPKAHHCHLCGAGYRSFHVEHAQHYHRYRLCDQELFTSEDKFLQHLHEFHGASHPSVLRNTSILEQNFSRNKGTSFEYVPFDEIMQGCRMDTEIDMPFVDPFAVKESRSTRFYDQATASSRPQTPARTDSDSIVLSNTFDRATRAARQYPEPASSKPPPKGPRFFRLHPLVPFLSSRIYYLRSAKATRLVNEGRAVLEEVQKPHIASLAMSGGLLGLATARMPVRMKKDDGDGVVEFALEEEDE